MHSGQRPYRHGLWLSALLGGLLAAVTVNSSCSSSKKPTAAAPAPETKKHGLTKEQAAKPLVKIGNSVITVGDFADRMAEQSPFLRQRFTSPERRKEFLDNLVRFELLAAEAQRRGYDKAPEVQQTREQIMIQQLMKRNFEDKVKIEDITDADVQTYFDAHPEEFSKPEQVRASHILMSDRAKAQRILAQILAAPTDAALFRRLADQNNQDTETKDRGGDLRFFSRPAERQATDPEVPAPVAEAAFALTETGAVSPELVQSPAGFHIVKLTGRRAALRRTVEDARRSIQNKLLRDRREKAITDYVAKLRAEANVEEHWENLGDVHIDIPAGADSEAPGDLGGMLGVPGGTRPGKAPAAHPDHH